MQGVRIDKGELLGILYKNRSNHRAIFEEALEGYRKRVIETLEDRLKDAREGRYRDVAVRLEQPVDQTKSYDRVIQMLEMCIDGNVTLSESEFASYVQDQWSWRSQFLSSNSAYSGTALAMSESESSFD